MRFFTYHATPYESCYEGAVHRSFRCGPITLEWVNRTYWSVWVPGWRLQCFSWCMSVWEALRDEAVWFAVDRTEWDASTGTYWSTGIGPQVSLSIPRWMGGKRHWGVA